jgi:hypothetical protein
VKGEESYWLLSTSKLTKLTEASASRAAAPLPCFLLGTPEAQESFLRKKRLVSSQGHDDVELLRVWPWPEQGSAAASSSTDESRSEEASLQGEPGRRTRIPSPRYLGPLDEKTAPDDQEQQQRCWWQLSGRPQHLGLWRLFRLANAAALVVAESDEEQQRWVDLAQTELGLTAAAVQILLLSEAEFEIPPWPSSNQPHLDAWEAALLHNIQRKTMSLVLSLSELASYFALDLNLLSSLLERMHGRHGLLYFPGNEAMEWDGLVVPWVKKLGPHYLALLDYLAAALVEANFGGSALHLSRLLRRTMCKLFHDLMGQKILRKIQQLN